VYSVTVLLSVGCRGITPGQTQFSVRDDNAMRKSMSFADLTGRADMPKHATQRFLPDGSLLDGARGCCPF